MAAALRSGQITIATAGTAQQGTDVGRGEWAIKAHPANANTLWVGDDGNADVTSSNGFPLDPGEGIVYRGSLNNLWFDVTTSGDKVCWMGLGS